MRTHRIELLVNKAEKARIEREAALLGTAPGEYVRKAAMLLDAEDVAGLEDVRSLLPELNAALTRIHDNLVAAAEHSERNQLEIERMRTPEYREEVRRSVVEDQAAVNAVISLLGLTRPEQMVANEKLRPSSHVSEAPIPWNDDNHSPNGNKPE
jgi:hypothetical protein